MTRSHRTVPIAETVRDRSDFAIGESYKLIALMHPKLKFVARPFADAVTRAWGAVAASGYHQTKTICVFAQGRSGSTLLAEILMTLPRRVLLWEPLHLGSNPSAARHGFDWSPYFTSRRPPSERQHDYVRRMLSARLPDSEIVAWRYLRPSAVLWPGGIVAKFVNGNLMADWVSSAFPVKSLLMLRHPCAVVGSQLEHGGWKGVTRGHFTIPIGLFDDFPQLGRAWDKVDSRESLFAFAWAMDVLGPLAGEHRGDWRIVFYEDIVLHSKITIDAIFTFLQLPVPDAAYSILLRPSTTTTSNTIRGVHGWREYLSPAEISAVLNIVQTAGVDVYGAGLLPRRTSEIMAKNLDRVLPSQLIVA